MRLISRADLKHKLDQSENVKLVFTLGPWQYQTRHIPGSLNLPCSVDLFASRTGLASLKPDDEIVVYCSSDLCYASISVYYWLTQRGFRNVRRYAGGLQDWYDAGYPLVGGSEAR